MQSQAKTKCYWFIKYGRVKDGCKIMTSLQCEKKGKCSFHETPQEFEARQADFAERHGTY